jgi:cell division transport system permease protein
MGEIAQKKVLGAFPLGMVVTGMTMALFVIGLFGTILFHASALSRILQESIEMHVVLDRDISDNDRMLVEKKLALEPWVLRKEGNPAIRFVSKADAADEFKRLYGEDFTEVLDENPLHPYFVVNLNRDNAEKLQLESISDALLKVEGVWEVSYREDLIRKLLSNIRMVTYILLAFAAVLIFVSILLINNTIRLAIYSQRFLIRSMQLVGATESFIKRPFIWRAAVQGLVAGMIAAGLLFAILNYAYYYIPDLKSIADLRVFAIGGGLCILGMALGSVSSWFAIGKYINKSLDQLY